MVSNKDDHELYAPLFRNISTFKRYDFALFDLILEGILVIYYHVWSVMFLASLGAMNGWSGY